MQRISEGTKPRPASGLIKKNYALPEITVKIMDELRSATDCTTETDVIKRALRLMHEVVKSGGDCLIRGSDGKLIKVIL